MAADIRTDVKRHYVNEIIDDLPDMIIGTDFIKAHRMLFATSQKRLYFTYLSGPVFYTDTPPATAAKAAFQ